MISAGRSDMGMKEERGVMDDLAQLAAAAGRAELPSIEVEMIRRRTVWGEGALVVESGT